MKALNGEQIRAVVHGAVAMGYVIYGDSFIGYKAFDDKGVEFDLGFCELDSDGDLCEEPQELLGKACEQLVSKSYNECEWW